MPKIKNTDTLTIKVPEPHNPVLDFTTLVFVFVKANV